MTKKKLIFVRINGTGFPEQFQALSHEIVGNPASTYHKFLMEDGTTVYFNDFGMKSVWIADEPNKLK